MAIDHQPFKVTRSRVDQATASYYPISQRVVLVADAANFTAAIQALTELRDYYGAREEVCDGDAQCPGPGAER